MAMREEDMEQGKSVEELKAAAKKAKKLKEKAERKKARTPEEKAQKQARARARRSANKRDEAISQLYKPLDQWDAEELARGKPRSADGSFRGPAPKWISAAAHEEAIKRFKDLSQSDMRALVPTALDTVKWIMTSEEVDDKDRPLVPAGVKLDAAKWTIEHLVGKPTQRTEMDISVKLQGVLANVMVMVGEGEDGELGGAAGALMPAMDVESWDPDEEVPEPGDGA